MDSDRDSAGRGRSRFRCLWCNSVLDPDSQCVVFIKTIPSYCSQMCIDEQKRKELEKKCAQFEIDFDRHLERAGVPSRYFKPKSNLKKAAKHIGGGVFLFGEPGTGKTDLACAIIAEKIRELRDEIVQNNFVHLPMFVHSVEFAFNLLSMSEMEKKAAYVKGIAEHKGLLVFDDLGLEKPTEFVLQCIYHIFNHRYHEMLPTIVTSPHEPPAFEVMVGQALASRIFTLCEPKSAGGKNWRAIAVKGEDTGVACLQRGTGEQGAATELFSFISTDTKYPIEKMTR